MIPRKDLSLEIHGGEGWGMKGCFTMSYDYLTNLVDTSGQFTDVKKDFKVELCAEVL
jgi:hypothetical protein